MSQIIHILPEKLCNQIAAGEVVERPASVAKELLENSLDAGATSIFIDVQQGGKRLVRVTDNGVGMSREDAFLCLERHATSKLQCEDDLNRLRTLGFRGEALPAISAVSRMLIRTRRQDTIEGWEITLEAGEVRRASSIGCPIGTTIEVRNLFYNLPARRKFLRRDETEFGHIADMVTRLALAKPQIQFRLTHNDRVLIDINRQNQLTERVADLLGPSILKCLVPLDRSSNGLRLHGLISEPATTRPTANSMFTYINGRYIRDRLVHHAIREGYRNVMIKGRHPIAALFLEMDPAQVDVNVHPTKHEVRFKDQAVIHDFIADTIRESLQSSVWLGNGKPADTFSAKFPPEDSLSDRTPDVRGSSSLVLSAEGNALGNTLLRENVPSYREEAVPIPTSPSLQPESKCEEAGFFGSLTIIGQYHNSYILCQDENDLLLIDQHAAHERIVFEQLKQQYRESEVEIQQLLFPVVLDFDFKDAAVVEENLSLLQQLGFDLDPFGGRSFALKGVARIVAAGEAEDLIRDVVGELVSMGRTALVEQVSDKLLTLMACHSVVRANQALYQQEMKALLKGLDKAGFNAQCPHGRPVVKRLTLAEVARMFKRT